MTDKASRRAALVDVLKDLKKAMRAKRAGRFGPKDEPKEEEQEDEEAEAMAPGRDSDGGSRASSSGGLDGGRLSGSSEAKESSGSPGSSAREEMIAFMTGRSQKAKSGKSAPLHLSEKKASKPGKAPKGRKESMG